MSCLLGGRGTPRSAVDARKAPLSPNGHGLRPPFGRRQRWRGSPSPQAPHSFPSALLPGEKSGTRGNPASKASETCMGYIDYLLKLFVKLVLTDPGADSQGNCVQFPCWRCPHTTEKAWFFRSFWAGRRCAAASRFIFFKDKTISSDDLKCADFPGRLSNVSSSWFYWKKK